MGNVTGGLVVGSLAVSAVPWKSAKQKRDIATFQSAALINEQEESPLQRRESNSVDSGSSLE